MVIDKLLLVNLKRYPQDRRSIYVTFKHLGANHPDLTLPLITSLLKIHPYFDKQVRQSTRVHITVHRTGFAGGGHRGPRLPLQADSGSQRGPALPLPPPAAGQPHAGNTRF